MTSLIVLQQNVADSIQKLNFPESPSSLYQPFRYLLAIGGKRMRPVLVLMGCELFEGDANKAMNAALGVELFHNFTLMHDDIMDKAPLRRSFATVHEKWNQNIAILSGDAMFAKSMQLMLQVPNNSVKPVMELFLKTAIEVCEGQQFDMDFESDANVDIESYLEMIRLKTAVLLGASLAVGAHIADADKSDIDHLYNFGVNLGVAFQLQDDILDVYGDATKFGKQIGGDIISNKKTFLLLTAISQAQGLIKESLYSLLHTPVTSATTESKVQEVISIYNKLNVREQAEQKMHELYKLALEHLEAIPVNEERKSPLRELAASLMIREQ
jgi:geranylgeranyl diphosphate synthase type II